jgi:SAM-dependent methyltransferase
MQSGQAFDTWMAALEARHLAELRFPEVARALRALSSTYVERRGRLAQGAALDGAGKRAAFALFYGPLHYLIVQHIAQSLLKPDLAGARPISSERRGTIVDLGCGTGAAGAACATACEAVDLVVGIDTHPWALTEAAATYRQFGLKNRTEKGDLASTRQLDAPRARSRSGPSLFVAAFALNELQEGSRDAAVRRLRDRAQAGDAVLIVEPLAGFVAPWWPRWQREIEQAGGRADEWRYRADLPEIVAKLDRAAGLDHRELTARSMCIPVIKN